MTSVLMLLLAALLILGLAGAHRYAVEVLAEDLVRWHVPPHERLELTLHVTVLVFLGAWLTAGFTHWRRWRVWAAWGALMAGVLAIDPLIEPAVERIGRLLNDKITAGPFDTGGWMTHLTVLAGTLVIAAAGIPLGQGIRLGWARYRARRWSRRRVKIRARRTAA